LGEPLHVHSGKNLCFYTLAGQSILHAQTVDGCTQHPHLIGGHRIHLRAWPLPAAPYVAGADDDAHLHTHILHLFDDTGYAGNVPMVEYTLFPAQCLTA
jgi:hypothetical protein